MAGFARNRWPTSSEYAPSETVYDFHRETKFWALGQERVLGTLPRGGEIETTIRYALQTGEGEAVEFKPFIRDPGNKLNEVVKTVIAFANTKGGVILLGVSDDCVIEGVEKDLAKESFKNQVSHDEQSAKYLGWLRQEIAGVLNRSLNLHIAKTEVSHRQEVCK